jgi:hypothetical protein
MYQGICNVGYTVPVQHGNATGSDFGPGPMFIRAKREKG